MSCVFGYPLVRDSCCEDGERFLPHSFLCGVSMGLGPSCYPCRSASGEPKGRRTHRFRSCGTSNVHQLPRRLKQREGRSWSWELGVSHESRPSDHDVHPKIILARRRRYRLRAHWRGVLVRRQTLRTKGSGTNRLTYAHFGHPLEIAVSAMGDDNQVVSPCVGIRRAEAAAET